MGNSSIRNGTFGNVNAGRVDPTGTIPLIQRVPYPQFSGILLAAGDGHGSYNAGTLSLTKRLSQGLSLLANYTWAKSVDDSSGEVNFTYRPEEGRKDMRGPSDFDINHRLVVSYVYDIPTGKGRRFLDKGGVVGAIAGGWQISGISTFQTGPVSTVNVPGDWAVRGPNLSTRPNCVSDPNQDALRSNARGNGLVYFNKDAFQFPAPFTLGNCGRNVLRLPGLNNWDLSAHKLNKLTERFHLQIRFEFFNVWNHAQWSTVSTGMSSTTFGRVTAARAGRDIQIGMKLVY